MIRLYLCADTLHKLGSLYASYTILCFDKNKIYCPLGDGPVVVVRCYHCLWEFCVWCLFCYAVLSALSSFAIISMRKERLVALL